MKRTDTKISGKLAGTYETVLAADTSARKRLVAVLTITEGNGHSLAFRTEYGKTAMNTQNLAAAIRFYDDLPGTVPDTADVDPGPRLFIDAGGVWTESGVRWPQSAGSVPDQCAVYRGGRGCLTDDCEHWAPYGHVCRYDKPCPKGLKVVVSEV